jgi:hypothetical protein
MKTLDFEEGTRRIVLRGSQPQYFADPWQNHHPLHVYAIVDFGSGERTVKTVDSEVFDYTPGEPRKSDDPARRLISISRSVSWDISEPDNTAPRPKS